MTKGIWESMKHRDKLFKALGKNDKAKIEAYRKKGNHVNRLIAAAKDLDMWNSFKNVMMNTPKKKWKKVNSKILNKKTREILCPL